MPPFKSRLISLLRWSERYTKTDMVYLTSGSFWLGTGQAASTLLVIALAIAMANLLPQETYGTYKFILALAGMIGAVSLVGMSTAVVQAVSRGYEGALRAGVATSLRWSLGTVVISIAAASYYFVIGDPVIALSLLIAGSFTPFLSSLSLFSSFLEGKKEFRTETLYATGRNLIASALLIFTIFLTDNPVIIILVYFISNTATIALAYWMTVRAFRPSERLDTETISYAKHLSAMGILSKVGGNLDKVLLFHFLGPAALAIYAFALAPVHQAENLRGVLARLALPKMGSRTLKELRGTIPGKALLLLTMMVCVVGAYILAAPFLYQMIFPQYLDSVRYSQLFSTVLLFAPTLLFSEALAAHRRKKELYIARISTAIISIGLLFALLPSFGLWGAIVALIASQAVSFAFYASLFYRAADDEGASDSSKHRNVRRHA